MSLAWPGQVGAVAEPEQALREATFVKEFLYALAVTNTVNIITKHLHDGKKKNRKTKKRKKMLKTKKTKKTTKEKTRRRRRRRRRRRQEEEEEEEEDDEEEEEEEEQQKAKIGRYTYSYTEYPHR